MYTDGVCRKQRKMVVQWDIKSGKFTAFRHWIFEEKNEGIMAVVIN